MYGKEVAVTLKKNLYVDDLLKSVQDKQTAIKLMKNVGAICVEEGFHLTKFVNKNKNVLLSIFFYLGFSFTNIHNSQDGKGGEATSLTLLLLG